MGEIDNDEVKTEDIEESKEEKEQKSIESEMDHEVEDDFKDSKEIEEEKLSQEDIEEEMDDDVEKNEVEHIKARNEKLEGDVHPETGVEYEKRVVEVDGEKKEIVAPNFESRYEAQLEKEDYEASDAVQFKKCNEQLKDAIEKDPDVRAKFTEEEIEDIENGYTPDGYTWHHDVEPGKMQLVDSEIHSKTGHTGGRYVWGGGTENR